MTKKITKILLAIVLLGGTVSAQVKRYVTVEGAGNKDGLTVLNASDNLQAMLDAANPGEEILVASGTYYPTVRQGGITARYEAFLLKDGVNIIGGYNIDFTSKTSTKSVLSGDLGTIGLTTDNAHNVVLALSLTVGVTLENLEITGGNSVDLGNTINRTVSAFSMPLQQGAGIVIRNSKLKLLEVIVKDNHSKTDAGAVHALGTVGSRNDLTIQNSVFQNNTNAAGSAGAIFLGAFSDLAVEESQFTNNGTSSLAASNTHGAVIFNNGTDNSLTFKKSAFNNNIANGYGGVFQINSALTLSIEDCSFINNQSKPIITPNNIGGGVISLYNSNASVITVKRSSFINNLADKFGGVLYSHTNAKHAISFENCLFANNSATTGGVLYYIGASPVIVNSTFYGNISSGSNTAAIHNTAAVSNTTGIYNSILIDNGVDIRTDNTGNSTFEIGASAFNGANTTVTIPSANNLTSNVTKERIFANYSYSNTGDVVVDAAANVNFLHLKDHFSNSVIDAGDNSKAPVGGDLAGNLRLIKTTNHTTNTSTVDLGPYELQITTLPVELIYYSAKATGNSSVLSWGTSSESNNNKFVIERSTDGVKFEVIGSVLAKLNTGASYNYTDYTPISGNNYYRLTQVDLDGKTSPLGVQLVKHAFDIDFHVYPNPVSGEIINVVLGNGNYHKLQVIDSFGKIISSASIYKQQDTATVDVSGLSKGIYLLRAIGDGKSIAKKFVR